MISRNTHNGFVWIDLDSPTIDEVKSVMDEFSIHPIAAEEMLLPTSKPKIKGYDDFFYMVLHFPAWRHSHKEVMQEVDFIIGKKFLITTRYDSVDAIHKFAKTLEVGNILHDKVFSGSHAGGLFYLLLRDLYTSLEDELDYLGDSLRVAEENIFAGREQEMVIKLSSVSRELLSFKHATGLHKNILDRLELSATAIFGKSFSVISSAIKSEYENITRSVDGYLESLIELRETNNAILETKQNKIIQTLTVITFVTSMLAIFFALLQIDTVARPIVGMENDFWLIVGITFSISGIMLAVFKWRKWL